MRGEQGPASTRCHKSKAQHSEMHETQAHFALRFTLSALLSHLSPILHSTAYLAQGFTLSAHDCVVAARLNSINGWLQLGQWYRPVDAYFCTRSLTISNAKASRFHGIQTHLKTGTVHCVPTLRPNKDWLSGCKHPL
jgi:hypothetical protein